MSTLYFVLLLLLLILIPSLTYALFFLLKCAPPSAEAAPPRAAVSKPAPVTVVSAGLAEEDCPVCLAAFEEGEELWRINLCRHLFHGACVARWLHAHANCPVCRAYVAPAAAAAAPKRVRLARADDLWQGMPDSAGLV